jgi:glycosyltransferase involved in cell wall biosynthesis
MVRAAVVIPVLNEAESLPELLTEIAVVADQNSLELDVFVVDDGSIDGSAQVAMAHGASVLRSSRNRGKSAALQAGFDATTEYPIIITMDGDLQDDPAEIPALVGALDAADLVSGWKLDRKDSRLRRFQSWLFTAAVRRASGVDIHDFNCGLKAYRREVVDDLRLYGDLHRLIPVLAHGAGRKVTEVVVNHRPRMHGRSRYGLGRALRGPFDLITVIFLQRLGQRPMHFFGLAGLLLGLIGIGIGAYLSWQRIVNDAAIGDRPLLMLAVLLIVVGLQLFGTGLIGEMLVAHRTSNVTGFRLQTPDRSEHGSGATND